VRIADLAQQPLVRYGAPVVLVALFTGIVALVRVAADVGNASMLYLLAVMLTALLFGSRAAIITSVLSFVAFNFFFIQPRYTFTVAEDDEWVALALLLITGVITGQLAAALQDRARRAEQREREAVVLYDIVRLVSGAPLSEALQRVAERLRRQLDLDAVVIAVAELGVARAAGDDKAAAMAEDAAGPPPMIMTAGLLPTADDPARPGRWVRIVKPGQARRDDGRSHVIPVRAAGEPAGSIALVRKSGSAKFAPVEDRLLSTVAHQLGQVAERLRLQHEATEAEVLRRTDELRSALLNAVSHDLRTPLASIIASGGSLLQEDVTWSDGERRAFAESIVEEAERLDQLVGNLLDLSRIESGALHPEKSWYDLPSLLTEVVGRLERRYPEARLSLDLPANVPPVLFDYVEVQQVACNLIENAVRHGAGEVRVSLALRDGEVEVEVSDTGKGIPDIALPHLFQPFYQAPGITDRQSGAGLGLAIAAGFVAAHGGRIWAENRPERGARFAFTMPLTSAPAAAAQA
jgi:two-component system sensor histidine kinase KdpD